MPLAAAAAAAFASVFHSGMAKANTADNVTNGQSDLGASGTYGGGSPTTSSDVTFTNVTYSPTAFTLNTNAANLNIGTLDDLDATQTLTIQNTTSGSTTTITLNGGSNSTASPANAADLLYVASGGTLSMGTAGAGTLGLALASSGNFDVAGTANVTSAISGSGFGFTKTGAGSLTLSGPNTYTGNTGVAMGNTTGLNTSSILNLSYAANQTNIINNAANSSALILGGSLTSDATTVLGGGRLTLTGVATSTNTQSFNGMTVGTGGNNIVFANNATANTIALNVGAISRTVGGTLHITQPTGTVSASNGVATTTGTASTILTDANGTAYATVGGTAAAAGDWAAKDSTNGFIVGGSTISGFYTTATSAATFSGNADVTTGFTATAGTTVNSIRMNNNTAQTLNINSSGNTTVSTGGILFGSTGSSVITGTGTAKLIAGAGKELVFINTSNGAPQISAVIADSGSGASSVTYRALQLTSGNGQFAIGSAGNSYTGNTYIESGRVATSVSTAFGTGAGANVYIDGNTNGQAYLTGGTFANHFYLVGNGWNETNGPYGALRLQGATVSGQVTLLGNATISDQGGTGTISGVIDDGGNAYALTVNGGNTLNLNNSNTYTGGTTIIAGTLSLGNSSALGAGTVTFNGGTLANSANVTLANNLSTTSNTANITASGGTMVLNGNTTGANGFNLTPTNKITLGGTNNITNTASGGAGLSITGGAGGVDITGSTTVAGTASTNNGYLSVAGTVTLTVQSGGSLTVNGTTSTVPNSIVGQNASGTSTLVVNGGTLGIGGNTGIAFGNNLAAATGVLTISSGTATITAGSTTLQNVQNFVALGRDAATGIINLDGGTLATGRQFVRDGSSGGTAGTGAATFNFNGGTLQAQADQTSGNGWFETATTGNFQVVTTIVKAGGAKIDTNSFTTKINTVLAHDAGLGATADGGLIKSGLGTLSLGGSSSYTGATTITAGTLALSGNFSNNIASSAAITVGSGATLDVTGLTNIAGTITLASGQKLGGIGTVNGKTIVASGSTISAGTSTTLGTGASNTTGTLTTGNEKFAAGGTYAVKTNDVTGTSGNATGWDDISMATLDSSALGSSTTFAVTFTSSASPAAHFANASNYTWVIANITTGSFPVNTPLAVTNSSGNSIGTTASSLFTLDTSAFVASNPVSGSGSSFYLEALGTQGGSETLEIGYNATPEPGTAMLILAGAIPMLTARRRRREADRRTA